MKKTSLSILILIIILNSTTIFASAAHKPLRNGVNQKKGKCETLRKYGRSLYFYLFPQEYDDEKFATLLDDVCLHCEEKEITPHDSSKIAYATTALKGNARPTMEDTYFPHANESPRIGHFDFFAVYDGHGGSKAVEYVSQRLHHFILKEAANPYHTIPQAMRFAFAQLNEALLAEQKIANLHGDEDSGTTATVAIIQNQYLYVANVGDSPAIISRNGHARLLSFEHKPNSAQEALYIKQRGGFVSEPKGPGKQILLCTGFRDDESPVITKREVKTFRVDGTLAMSRAFGNYSIARYISATPFVQEAYIDPNTEFLILVTDGISNVMTPQAIVDFVFLALKRMRISRNQASPFHAKIITDALVKFALKILDHDNVTAQLIFFKINSDGEPGTRSTF